MKSAFAVAIVYDLNAKTDSILRLQETPFFDFITTPTLKSGFYEKALLIKSILPPLVLLVKINANQIHDADSDEMWTS